MINRRRHVNLLGRMIFVVQQRLPSFVIIVSCSVAVNVCAACVHVHSCALIGRRSIRRSWHTSM